MLGCRNPVKLAGGRFSPAANTSLSTWMRLTDGATMTYWNYTGGAGAYTTNTSASPYITVFLDGEYDLGAVAIWPASAPYDVIALGQQLTVWIHSASADFSADAGAVKCAEALKTTTGFETYSQCPDTSGVKYVTVQRFGSGPIQLALQEVRVYTTSAYWRAECMRACA